MMSSTITTTTSNNNNNNNKKMSTTTTTTRPTTRRPSNHPAAATTATACRSVFISFLLLTSTVANAQVTECDFSLSDSPKEGKVVHTFQTTCEEGEITWRYPYSGLELTFKRPLPSPASSSPPPPGSRRLTTTTATTQNERYSNNKNGGGDNDNKYRNSEDDGDDDHLRFCYAVERAVANATMLRELPGGRFLASEDKGSCLDEPYSFHKFYIESRPSQNSSLLGRFHMRYLWTRRTPFEKCKRCKPSELNTAVCTAGSIFTGRVESPADRGTIAVSVDEIYRLEVAENIPEGSCIRRSGKWRPFHQRRRWNRTSRRSAAPGAKRCDSILIPDGRICSYEAFPPIVNRDDEFVFVADVALGKFRPRCVIPVKKFWKTWGKLEKRGETDCSLDPRAPDAYY